MIIYFFSQRKSWIMSLPWLLTSLFGFVMREVPGVIRLTFRLLNKTNDVNIFIGGFFLLLSK